MWAGLEDAGGWWERWNLGYGLCREQKCHTLTWGWAAALWAMHSALSFSFIPAGWSCWLPQYFACGEYSVFEQLSAWREFLQTWRACIWACIRGPGCWTACHLNAHSCKLICSAMAERTELHILWKEENSAPHFLTKFLQNKHESRQGLLLGIHMNCSSHVFYFTYGDTNM